MTPLRSEIEARRNQVAAELKDLRSSRERMKAIGGAAPGLDKEIDSLTNTLSELEAALNGQVGYP